MSLRYIKLWSETITALHSRWKAHPGQQEIINSVFFEGIKSHFVRCGRKWGKTETALYLLWRVAQSIPGSPCFYLGPLQNQVRSILWDDPRLTGFGPREWLLDGSRGINETQMLLRFKNGSFIKIDGTDNWNKYRGIKYKIAIYDEYKDCDPRMRRSMRPNASVLDGIDVYMGSPPEIPDTDYELLDREHQADQDSRSWHAPSTANPWISKQWLYNEKTKLYARGEGDEWEREYGARYVKGGASLIFPMYVSEGVDSMMRPHDQIMVELHRDRRKLDWYWWNDPAGATCFATLFVAINRYSKRVYVLDEIYEKDQKEMTTKRIGARAIKIRNELYSKSESWRGGYDEAATWFVNEWIDNFPDEGNLEPSAKSLNDKKNGLSLIKDIMLKDLLTVSDRCANFSKEISKYQKDKNGNIPKKDDHLIDDFRYILGAAAYKLDETEEYQEERDENFRGQSLEDALSPGESDPYESDFSDVDL